LRNIGAQHARVEGTRSAFMRSLAAIGLALCAATSFAASLMPAATQARADGVYVCSVTNDVQVFPGAPGGGVTVPYPFPAGVTTHRYACPDGTKRTGADIPPVSGR
jgi:hypothetical protein